MTSAAEPVSRAAPSPATRAARGFVLRMLAGVRGGTVVLRLPGGETRRFGDGAGPEVAVTVYDDRVWAKLVRHTRVGLGDSYVDGDWDADDLVALASLLIRSAEAARSRPAVRALHRLQAVRPRPTGRNDLRAARRQIAAHYDLGNDLFRLFLDESLTYSCAYWTSPAQTLEQAQRAKLELVCDKLALGPDDHVLEVGCGWGSFALHAAKTRGCRVTGLTLSREQAALARERVAAAGLEERVELVEQDYRLHQGSYSRLVSIEMLEAVGHAQYPTFFRAVDRLLAPDGLALVQVIGVPDERYERYRRSRDWIQAAVFPGSLLPSLEALVRAAAPTGLVVHGVEEIGIGYSRTLREWRERFTARLDEVRALGYDERFVRTWTLYLSLCEAGFATRSLRDMQLVLTRPFNDSLPALPGVRPTF